jgi:predicted MPP superfamily phosphohydrolase
MLRFALTFTGISTLICGLTFFLLRHRLNLSRKGNLRLMVFLVITALLMIIGPLVYRRFHASIENPFQEALQFTQYFLMGWVAMTMLTFLVLEIIQQIVKPFDPMKRIFLTEGVARGIVAGTTIAALGGLAQAEMGPNIKPIQIKLKTLPKNFDQMVIAQISDIHIGPLLHERFLNRVVDQVLSLKPDVIVVTGDLVDGTVDQLRALVEPLTRLKAKEGIYFCTGNHEYYSGAEEWIAHIESMGIHVFKNSNVVLNRTSDEGITEKLMIAGVYDWQAWKHTEAHRADPVKAAKTDEPVSCKILLAHNPQSTEVNAAAGFHLQLSGHTHAGQFYPFVFLAGFVHKYFEGLYTVNDTMQVYVNRGTGYWGPPNRLGKSSEVTQIVLTRA